MVATTTFAPKPTHRYGYVDTNAVEAFLSLLLVTGTQLQKISVGKGKMLDPTGRSKPKKFITLTMSRPALAKCIGELVSYA